MRTMRVLTTAVALVTIATLAQAAPVPLSAGAPVRLEIPRWMDVFAEAVVGPWGQGHTSLGDPGPLDGADAQFVGGSETETWLDGEDMPYATGAIARSALHIRANCRWAVKVPSLKVTLPLSSGTDSLSGIAQIGFRKPDGRIQLTADTDSLGNPPTGQFEAPGYYLYALVGRNGLADSSGTYVGSTVVQIYHNSAWSP